MSSRAAIDREALRGLIRQVLQDAVPADVQKKLSAALKNKSAAPKAEKPLPPQGRQNRAPTKFPSRPMRIWNASSSACWPSPRIRRAGRRSSRDV